MNRGGGFEGGGGGRRDKRRGVYEEGMWRSERGNTATKRVEILPRVGSCKEEPREKDRTETTHLRRERKRGERNEDEEARKPRIKRVNEWEAQKVGKRWIAGCIQHGFCISFYDSRGWNNKKHVEAKGGEHTKERENWGWLRLEGDG